MSPPRTSYGTRPPPTGARGQASNVPYGTVPKAYSGTATQKRIHIEWSPQATAYAVKIPYDENFIEFIKAKIPGNKRSWDGSSKTWFVEDGFEDVLRVLATELWGAPSVTYISKKEVEDSLRTQVEQQRAAVLQALPPLERCQLEFFELLSLAAMKAAYRVAATEFHPDKRGGNADAMTRLNTTWNALEKELAQNGK